MDRVAIAAAIAAVAIAVALVARRRRPDPPTQRRGAVPVQVDRADFARPDAPWLVVVFTSATCQTCAKVVSTAAVLTSAEVVVEEVEYGARGDVQRRYGIEAVPTVVIADAAGVVRTSIQGPVNATDLWAAMATVRAAPDPPEV